MSKSRNRWALAEAPATVANVAVGFDCMGFAIPVAADRVRVERLDGTSELRIDEIRGLDGLPMAPDKNTATVALAALQARLGLDCGFAVEIEKGIPLASGLGGSAASAVAAVVAAAGLIDPTPAAGDLLAAATVGEGAVSGAPHADNTAASLFGGCLLVLDHQTGDTLPVHVPDEVVCSLVRPHIAVETKTARSVLSQNVPLELHARQAALLGGFLLACEREDWERMGRCLRDVVIEPQRSRLIPGFHGAQQAGRDAGALGVSIGGAGPTMFAWSRGQEIASKVTEAMAESFGELGTEVDAWTAEIAPGGARIVSRGPAGS